MTELTLINLQEVTKEYMMGEVSVFALKELSLSIEKGKFVILLGPSGSGKTTLLNLISAIDTPSKGKILVEGLDISFLTRKQRAQFRRQKIGFIFQFFNLLPTLSAVENVEFSLALVGIPDGKGGRVFSKKAIRDSALEWLDLVGLGHRSDHFPSQLSGGEQQRVAIARALAKDDPIIIADEPTGNLDYKTGINILKLMKELNENTKKTFMIATHNNQLAKLADIVISLQMGRVEIYEQIPVEDLSKLVW